MNHGVWVVTVYRVIDAIQGQPKRSQQKWNLKKKKKKKGREKQEGIKCTIDKIYLVLCIIETMTS